MGRVHISPLERRHGGGRRTFIKRYFHFPTEEPRVREAAQQTEPLNISIINPPLIPNSPVRGAKLNLPTYFSFQAETEIKDADSLDVGKLSDFQNEIDASSKAPPS